MNCRKQSSVVLDKNAGKDLFMLLKRIAGLPGPQFGLKISGYENYFIRPVPTKNELIISSDVVCLTKWRNKFKNSFLTEFEATEERTFKWLDKEIHVDDSRMLFMVENNKGEQVGYLGIGYIDWEASYVEADSIVSGGNSPKGLMAQSLKTLLRWTAGQMGLATIGVRVLSDNPALSFYKKIGFMEINRIPLRREADSVNYVVWKEDSSMANSERYLVHHIWTDS